MQKGKQCIMGKAFLPFDNIHYLPNLNLATNLPRAGCDGEERLQSHILGLSGAFEILSDKILCHLTTEDTAEGVDI